MLHTLVLPLLRALAFALAGVAAVRIGYTLMPGRDS